MGLPPGPRPHQPGVHSVCPQWYSSQSRFWSFVCFLPVLNNLSVSPQVCQFYLSEEPALGFTDAPCSRSLLSALHYLLQSACSGFVCPPFHGLFGWKLSFCDLRLFLFPNVCTRCPKVLRQDCVSRVLQISVCCIFIFT